MNRAEKVVLVLLAMVMAAYVAACVAGSFSSSGPPTVYCNVDQSSVPC